MLQGGNILLKSTSTLVDPRGLQCKIGDFGLSRVMNAGANHVTTDNFGEGGWVVCALEHACTVVTQSVLKHAAHLHRHRGLLRARGAQGGAADPRVRHLQLRHDHVGGEQR
jgi:hypothetical protein